MGGEEFFNAATTIFGFIALVALVAVIVSKNSTTAALIQNTGTAFGSDLAVAISPVTGVGTAPNLTYAGGSPFALG